MHAENIQNLVLWYYTPMALSFSDHLRPCAVVYDCMDELSAFAGAPPELPAAEAALLERADLVLTGGHSLYAAKQRLHQNVHEFPSGVDVEHFAAAQRIHDDPADQSTIPKPRIGFFGVLDERLDRELLAAVAAQAPGWAFVLIGPVTKISPNDLPRAPNLHYLGPKSYDDLPRYIAGWDVAMMPFALNAATRYISPTKTPEYLAAGKPVVSTPIADVVRTYGDIGLAHIADTPNASSKGSAMPSASPPSDGSGGCSRCSSTQSWDGIWSRVSERLRAAIIERHLKSGVVAGATSISVGRDVRHVGRITMFDYLVVGAGFAGAVMAERLAEAGARKVLVVDKRMHLGGNALRLLRQRRHPDAPLRATHLSHQFARGLRVP